MKYDFFRMFLYSTSSEKIQALKVRNQNLFPFQESFSYKYSWCLQSGKCCLTVGLV